MNEENKAFLQKLLATFRSEAEEHVKTLSSGLIALEKTPTDAETIETIFRAAHSLKGASRTVNLLEIEALCHALENIFSAVKHNKLIIKPPLYDVLHNTIDMISTLLTCDDNGVDDNDKQTIEKLLQYLDVALEDNDKLPITTSELEQKPASDNTPSIDEKISHTLPQKYILTDTVKISADKLDALLRKTEELLSVKLISSQCITGIRTALTELGALKKKQTRYEPIRKMLQQATQSANQHEIKKSYAQLEKLLDLVTWESTFVDSFETRLEQIAQSSEQNQHSLTTMLDGLLDDMKRILMLPVSTTMELFPKLVRDISHAQGKQVELVIHGAETEIDRRILETMYDPLIHLVRNSVDHGIETPDIRQLNNKSPKGTITITVRQRDGGNIEILVADDGAGIDMEKIQDKANELGITAPLENLIFQSGVSTSPIITELSGRGLGLAIVWEKIQTLGGVISVESQPGCGTLFKIILPLTLATFRGVYVRVQDRQFLLPTMQIEQCLRINRSAIKSVENRETILWRDQVVTLVNLGDVLGLPRQKLEASDDMVYILVLGATGNPIAFSVDEILSEEDILLKNLNKQLARVQNIAGATVLGNGKTVPVLNVIDLLRSAMHVATTIPVAHSIKGKPEDIKRKAILVVEDSITSRTLLKNILESAGYQVATAVDGLDGYTHLKTNAVDLVMSDVSMPRMNGFELTEKIRATKDLSQLPIVLVTSLESREDRERGIDAGANAYIIKSSFNQDNLLDIVGRLI